VTRASLIDPAGRERVVYDAQVRTAEVVRDIWALEHP
jgi:hypothetical protein